MFSQRLKQLRRENKVTQQDLAAFLEVDRTSITKWETTDVMPDGFTLAKIAKYFSVSMEYLIGTTNDRRRVEDLLIPNIGQIYDQASKMDLPEEFKKAIINAKKLPISEQRACLTNALMDFHNLPEEARSVILKIINSYSPS